MAEPAKKTTIKKSEQKKVVEQPKKVEQPKVEQKVEKKPETKKLVPIQVKDIDEKYLKIMFIRDKLDKKLDKTREDILDEFVKEYNNPNIVPTFTDKTFRERAIFSRIFLKFAPIIKSNSSVGTVVINSKLSDAEARDTNANKGDPSLKENWVRNFFGLLFDKITGSFIPFSATGWGEIAESNIPFDKFIKVQYRPATNKGDEPKYRAITIGKVLGEDKLIYKDKEVKVPEDITKYIPIIPAQEVEPYVNKVITVTGQVMTFNDKLSKNQNYTISILSADPLETSMDETVTVLGISKIKPVWEQNSQVKMTGKVFAPRQEEEDTTDDSGFEVVGGEGEPASETAPLPEEPEEEPKGKMYNMQVIKIEPIGEEGKDWFKATSNEISASGEFKEYDDVEFEKEMKTETEESIAEEKEVVVEGKEEMFNLEEE